MFTQHCFDHMATNFGEQYMALEEFATKRDPGDTPSGSDQNSTCCNIYSIKPVEAVTRRMNGPTKMKLLVTGSNLFGSKEQAMQVLTLSMNQKGFCLGG